MGNKNSYLILIKLDKAFNDTVLNLHTTLSKEGHL